MAALKLSLEALQVIDAIDRRGSYAAAAQELHRVPSALSYAVQKLEQDLDLLVFDRRGHRVRLTEAGRELLDEGRHLLRAAGELECRVRRVATGWETELRIAVDTDLVVRPGGNLFGKNMARVAFKRGSYLRNFVLDFAAMLSERLDRDLITKALEGRAEDYQL